ncbi:DNA primase [Paenibacillus chitinolyticus]|uniref:DNA primase n=1 Tax=Paenibacillus chitinolyticus TaxID=79263 RepID=A0A410WWW8_9BACL|nr:DNA primase [Paenibacillus chitinolyticus]MCY9592352.1 DNA primase [Paenibacillus chitinolyticus]MCY9599813.1 DNA primase [Paenibacillus chitinolyticus]QAV18908.1 DNA primase [Paenibacillus chitinolyticus]
MINDLMLIKKRIITENRIEEILSKAGCENIKEKSNRYESMLPDKFESDNSRGLQVYLNESLTCKIRNRTFLGSDIFDLISYIVFDKIEALDIHKCLPKSKRWICEQLGYHEYLTGEQVVVFNDPLKWLKDIKKNRSKSILEVKENKVLSDDSLDRFVMFPHAALIEEGIEYGIQQEFQVGFDLKSERIIFPIHNSYGEIVSIKGRTTDPDYKIKDIPKYLYLHNFNNMWELYNWHRALWYIIESKEIIIYEAEKTCWLSTQFGVRNCVALGGSEVTDYQARMIKSLGIDIKIVLAFDRDKKPEEIKLQAQKFGKSRSIFVMWDGKSVFTVEAKHSPTDLGFQSFMDLYKDHYNYRIS